jgi:hypothetical protein
MNNLPYEINSLIFKQLDKKNLNNCLFVNKSFANFIYKLLWNTISLKNVKVLTKLWFEDEEGNKNNFSNVINPNLMFPFLQFKFLTFFFFFFINLKIFLQKKKKKKN